MSMIKSFRIPSATVITASILLMTGCGGGGGGETGFPKPTLPANAVVFDDANAMDVANAVLDSRNNLGTATARNAESKISIQDAIDLAITFTMVMNLSETVNFSTGDFTVSQSFSVSGLPVGNFLVTTPVPFVGNAFLGEIDSGQLLIQGGNNTQIRITVIAVNTVRVELDEGLGGGYVEIAGSPILITP